MTQTDKLQKIVEIIQENKTISKHIIKSWQANYGMAPITIWDTSSATIEIFVDTDKNIFSKTLEKLIKENSCLIKDAYFVKSDGSCHSFIVIK